MSDASKVTFGGIPVNELDKAEEIAAAVMKLGAVAADSVGYAESCLGATQDDIINLIFSNRPLTQATAGVSTYAAAAENLTQERQEYIRTFNAMKMQGRIFVTGMVPSPKAKGAKRSANILITDPTKWVELERGRFQERFWSLVEDVASSTPDNLNTLCNSCTTVTNNCGCTVKTGRICDTCMNAGFICNPCGPRIEGMRLNQIQVVRDRIDSDNWDRVLAHPKGHFKEGGPKVSSKKRKSRVTN